MILLQVKLGKNWDYGRVIITQTTQIKSLMVYSSSENYHKPSFKGINSVSQRK